MKSKRMLVVVITGIAVAVGSGIVPVAGGAAPHSKTSIVTALCGDPMDSGAKPLGNKGVVDVSAKGSTTGTNGTAVKCVTKLKGKWKKNSTQFSFSATGQATLGENGSFTLNSATDLSPLTGRLTGSVTGTGLPAGTALTIEINCNLSYPPLKIECRIIISA